jgi:ABC-2 type transport system ATP-binding protein
MLQRTGLAAALVSDPELLVLDEPMSGLDPVGRKDVRDIIVEERRAGRTILFSTHILSDVETLCDRVAILRKGKVVVTGHLDQLLRRDVELIDVHLAAVDNEKFARLLNLNFSPERLGSRIMVRIEGSEKLQQAVALLLSEGFHVIEVSPRQEKLEDLFVREAIG